MKPPFWIRVIGIGTIVLGIWGLFEGIASYIVIELRQFRPNSFVVQYLWAFRLLSITAVLIGLYYIFAGYAYLFKKKFAREVIRSAIIINLFYEVSTMLFFSIFIRSHGAISFSYHMDWHNFLRPTFDVLLLIGVIRMRPYYFQRFIESGHHGLPRIYSFIGLAFLLVPLSIFTLWIYSGIQFSDYLDKLDYFRSFFPESIRAPKQLTYVELVFSAMAVIFSLISLNARNKWKYLSYLVLTIGSLFVLLFTFQLA